MTGLKSCLKRACHSSLIPPPADSGSRTKYITEIKSKSTKKIVSGAIMHSKRAAIPSSKRRYVSSLRRKNKRVQFASINSFSSETDPPASPPPITYGRRIHLVNGIRPEFSPDRELDQNCFDRIPQRKRNCSCHRDESLKNSYAPTMGPIKRVGKERRKKFSYSLTAEQQEHVDKLQQRRRRRSCSSDSNGSIKSLYAPKMASIKKPLPPETHLTQECSIGSQEKPEGRLMSQNQPSNEMLKFRNTSYTSYTSNTIQVTPSPKPSDLKSEATPDKISNSVPVRSTESSIVTKEVDSECASQRSAKRYGFSKFIISQNFTLTCHENGAKAQLSKVLAYFDFIQKQKFGRNALLPTPETKPLFPY